MNSLEMTKSFIKKKSKSIIDIDLSNTSIPCVDDQNTSVNNPDKSF